MQPLHLFNDGYSTRDAAFAQSVFHFGVASVLEEAFVRFKGRTPS